MDPHDPLDPIYPDQYLAEPVAPAGGNAWLTPAKLTVDATPARASRASMYDLRPLTTGEVLDRTFSVYRARFWLFAGISSVSAAVQLVANVVQMLLTHLLKGHLSAATLVTLAVVFVIVVLILFLMAYSVTQAATVYAVSEVYLGRDTTIGASLRATARRWYVYIGIAFWQMCSAAWLPLSVFFLFAALRFLVRDSPVGAGVLAVALILGLLGSYVMGLILYLRNLLAVPVTVVETLKLRASMRRSKVLAAGTKWRIFLTLLICAALFAVLLMFMIPLFVLASVTHATGVALVLTQIGILLVTFVGYSLISPVMMIGLSLIYFDQRVRKEAFDIAVLLGEEQVIGNEAMVEAAAPAVAAAVPVEAAAEAANVESEDAAVDDIQI